MEGNRLGHVGSLLKCSVSRTWQLTWNRVFDSKKWMADPLAEAQELWFSNDLFFSGILGEPPGWWVPWREVSFFSHLCRSSTLAKEGHMFSLALQDVLNKWWAMVSSFANKKDKWTRCHCWNKLLFLPSRLGMIWPWPTSLMSSPTATPLDEHIPASLFLFINHQIHSLIRAFEITVPSVRYIPPLIFSNILPLHLSSSEKPFLALK